MILLLAAALIFTLGDKEFVPVDEIYSPSLVETAHAWVPASLYSHEILLLDPDESPLLDACYTLGKTIFEEAAIKGLPTLLSTIATFLHTDVFTNRNNRREAIDAIIDSWDHPCVPLDIFIANRTGVCRHFVVTAAYILARLKLENLCDIPEIHIIRRNLRAGRHAWLQVGRWHFDPYWNLIADITDDQEREFLYQVYGHDAITPIKENLHETQDNSLLRGFQHVGQKSCRSNTFRSFRALARHSFRAFRQRPCSY